VVEGEGEGNSDDEGEGDSGDEGKSGIETPLLIG